MEEAAREVAACFQAQEEPHSGCRATAAQPLRAAAALPHAADLEEAEERLPEHEHPAAQKKLRQAAAEVARPSPPQRLQV